VRGTVSCSSCHIKQIAFGDTARCSLGHDGVSRTDRHAMRLVNVRYFPSPRFGWAMATYTLESQVLRPITASVGMGFTAESGGVDSLTRRTRTLPYCPELFRLAFGDESDTLPRMQSALAMFVRSIVSSHSRWDSGYEPNVDLTTYDQGLRRRLLNESEVERVGRLLFFAGRALGATLGCAACHLPPHFASPGTPDGIGLSAGERRAVKAPSLKNVAVAGRYMHDGGFATPEEAIHHYDVGLQDGPALGPLLRDLLTGRPLRMGLDAYGRGASGLPQDTRGFHGADGYPLQQSFSPSGAAPSASSPPTGR
jgi:cytochrome c peroxidase